MILTRKHILCCVIALLFVCPAGAEEKNNYSTTSQIPRTTRQMHAPGFWISRHPSVDQIILTDEGINQLNTRIQDEAHLTKDIFVITQDFKSTSLVQTFEGILKNFVDKGYYTSVGMREDRDYFEKVRRNMNMSAVVLGVGPRYGLVSHFTNVRFFPTDEPLYAQKDDEDFDQVQNSALDVGSAVAVVHTSSDRKWFYVMSQTSDGWVKAEDIVLGEINQVKAFAQDENFIVVTAVKADIFRDEAKNEFYDFIRMGVRLPLAGMEQGGVRVNIPTENKEGKLTVKEAFMNERDVHPGFLPYTARTVYTQGFALLNQPYGWGDANGEQDCSRFIQMIFATMGIVLPRDSKDQAQVGTSLVEFDEKSSPQAKQAAVLKSVGAQTILPLKGHIMLYLGEVDGRPFVMHATSGYRQKQGEKEVTKTLMRVVLSDLSLGEGSTRGSLLKRIIKIVEVK